MNRDFRIIEKDGEMFLEAAEEFIEHLMEATGTDNLDDSMKVIFDWYRDSIMNK